MFRNYSRNLSAKMDASTVDDNYQKSPWRFFFRLDNDVFVYETPLNDLILQCKGGLWRFLETGAAVGHKHWL